MFNNPFEGFFQQAHQEEEQVDDDPQHTLYYDILAVEKNATDEDLKKAYKRSQTKGPYRDPKYGGDPEKHKQMEDAYATLIDPEKRKLYDQHGKKYERILKQQKQQQEFEQEQDQDYEDEEQGDFQSPFDIFQMLGGQGQRRQKGQKKGLQKGKPQVKQLEVTLNDIYRGKKVQDEFTRKRLCEQCKGSGGKNVQKCPKCKGHRMITKMIQLGPGMYSQSTQPCYDCNGQGEIIDQKDKCKICKGQKIMNKQVVMDIQLERGVPDDHDYKFENEGDEQPGFSPSDLYFRIKTEKHDIFTRKGADLFMNKDISLNEALTGFSLEIKHLDSTKFYIQSRPGEVIEQNSVKCIKGKGMPFYKNDQKFGNLYIQFNIVMPEQKSLDPEVLKQIANLLPGPKFQPYGQNEKYEMLDEYTENDFNTAAEGGRNKDEEDENDLPHGGTRLQCNQQ